MKLIDKDALVAEIDRRIKETESIQPKFDQFWAGQISAFKGVLKILDTLEMKEVDLWTELGNYIEHYRNRETGYTMFDIAEHFFELGLKANQENNVIGTIEREVKIDAGGYPYINCDIEFYDYDKDVPLAKEGEKVKVIVVKEE